jgi:hypothetical protein
MHSAFDAVVKAAVVRKQTQLSQLGQSQGASHHALTQSKHLTSYTLNLTSALQMLGRNGRNDFGINLLFGCFAKLTPQGLVVHHNAVVNHAYPIAVHRLVISQAIGDQSAVTHDHTCGGCTDPLEQSGYGCIRSVEVITLGVTDEQTAGVFATLLCMMGQQL